MSAYSSLAGSNSSIASAASSACSTPRTTLPRTRPSPGLVNTGSLPNLQLSPMQMQVSEVPITFDSVIILNDPPRAAQRRQRSPGDEAEEEAKRPCVDTPPPRASFAQAARTPPRTPTGSAAPARPATSSSGTKTGATQKKLRYPPLVVEKLPSWAHHFKALKAKLGRAPNARPYGSGVRFTPQSEDEYRITQRYLTELEKEENVVWFSYSLPAEKSLKVAIRGLPTDTEPEDISEELRALGYDPEYVRHIKARQGRPGCIFHAVLRKTPNLTPGIYQITELLCMPGIKIEAWRGRKGPSQCHKCQGFRHSSQLCHRPLACVKCGGEHRAADCTRPREEPATCRNCGGAHPANYINCPVLRKEVRNTRAGTVAISGERRENKNHRSLPQTHTQ